MSLKVLVLPTFILLELILAIGYIKPNIDDILAKRIEIQTAKDDLTKVDSVAANIETVGQSIATHSREVNFVEKYYPKMLDEERVIDMFNFFAQQSGIIVTDIGVAPEEATRGVADTAYNDALNAGKTAEEAALLAEAASMTISKSYRAQVSVIGTYGNIKDFFSKIRHTDRLHTTSEFSIKYRGQDSNKAEEEAAVGIQPNFLIGTLSVQFPYLGQQRTSDPLNDSLFQSATFNWSTVDRVISYVKNPLPPLESGQSGRDNPFE